MNISVISPKMSGCGTTTVAGLLAFELSSRNKNVCLTHAKSKSSTIYPYFGFESSTDQTTNPVQLVNLIKEGGLRKEDIKFYCKEVTERLDLFSIEPYQKDNISEERINRSQMQTVLNFVTNDFPYDYVVFDMDEDIENENSKIILSKTDCLIIVLPQSIGELRRFYEHKEKIFRIINKLPCLVVVNKYVNMIGSVKEVAMEIGIKNPKKWYTIRYNPWITYCENRGKFIYLGEEIQKRNIDVIDIDSDIKQIATGIQSVKQASREERRIQRGY